MYAIFEAKGKQVRAEPGTTLRLPSLDAEPGERVTFGQVLLAERDGEVLVGRPSLQGATVATEVLRHGRDDKIVVYKMKRRKGYRRKQGHRQGFTEVRVVDIELAAGGPAPPEKAKKTAAKAKAKEAAPPKAKKTAPAKVKPVPEAGPGEAPEILVTDSARSLAEEAGVDLATIEGTGKSGRILKSDVQKAIKQQDGE
jgi:large subunit ribosomal protein L21